MNKQMYTDSCTNKTTEQFFTLQPNLTNTKCNELVFIGHKWAAVVCMVALDNLK